MMNSGMLGRYMATRSPCSTPSLVRAAAKWSTDSSSSW